MSGAWILLWTLGSEGSDLIGFLKESVALFKK